MAASDDAPKHTINGECESIDERAKRRLRPPARRLTPARSPDGASGRDGKRRNPASFHRNLYYKNGARALRFLFLEAARISSLSFPSRLDVGSLRFQ